MKSYRILGFQNTFLHNTSVYTKMLIMRQVKVLKLSIRKKLFHANTSVTFYESKYGGLIKVGYRMLIGQAVKSYCHKAGKSKMR